MTIKLISETYQIYNLIVGAAVAEWLSSWLAEQEVWGSIPGLSPASKSRYGLNTA